MDEKLQDQLPRLYGPVAKNHGRAKAQLLASLPDEAPRRSTPRWRRAARLLAGDEPMTIKRGILRLTPAAAAVAAAVIGAWMLIGPGGVESVYAQLNQAVANTNAAEWVHFKGEVFGKAREVWFSVDPIREAIKSADRTDYLDGPGLRHYIYEPDKGTLRIVSLRGEGEATLAKLKQKTFLGVMLASFEQQIHKGDGKLTRRTETSKGKKYTVFTYESAQRGEAMSLWVDPATNRVAVITGEGGTWSKPMRLELDYPKTGPTDIYALGVPRDAKVIDNTGGTTQPAGDPSPLSAALAMLNRAAANTNAAQWVHFKGTWEGTPAEGWISVDPIRQVIATADWIQFVDGASWRWCFYTTAKRTLEITPFDQRTRDDIAKIEQKTFLEAMLGVFGRYKETEGGTLTRRAETVDGKTYTVFTFRFAKRIDGKSLWVNPATKRVELVTGQSGDKPIRLKLDYPTTGPTDVYAVGVPRDAKVVDHTAGPARAVSRPATGPVSPEAVPAK